VRRRDFILASWATITWPLSARAQDPGRTYRLGFLISLFDLSRPMRWPLFFGQLAQHGFKEGKNLTYEFRAFAPHPERMSEYAVELVKDRVDLILTGGPPTRAVQEATKTIPILALDIDLVGSGFVNSMARPDGKYNRRQLPLDRT